MGKSTPKPPAPPDPNATAAAQTSSNIATAETNAALNRVNEYTPYGNLTYNIPDPTNAPYSWTATQTLSPAEQQKLDLTNQADILYGNTALKQLGTAASTLATPINTNYNDVRNQTIQAQMALIQPQLDQQRQALSDQLQAQGVTQGSQAWYNAMQNANNQQSSMYNNILANAGNTVGQAIQQQIALRQEPLNETAALMSGQQIQGPSFTNVPTSNVQPTDVLAAYNQSLQQADFNYQQQMANQSSALGGIGSLVGTIGGAALMGPVGGALGGMIGGGAGTAASSDERLKTDISQVGMLNTPGGKVPLKTFRFKGSPVRHLGLIAQDVEKTDPGAVSVHPLTGLRGVNYARVLMSAGQRGSNGGQA